VAEADEAGKPRDTLKLYVAIFLAITAVLVFFFFRFQSEREDYAGANALAEQYLTGKGLRRGTDDRPPDLPGLAFDVERFLGSYRAMGGEEGGTISADQMAKLADTSGLKQTDAAAPRTEFGRNRTYLTLSQKFTYMPSNLDRLTRMVYNIETQTRYRVTEITWKLLDGAANPKPFNNIQKSSIQVAVRTPATKLP
jgi:hypothetical protein